MRRSERYRALADLLAYLEGHNPDENYAVIDDGEGFEIAEFLYQELIASTEANALLDTVKTTGVTLYRYDTEGRYLGIESEAFDWITETSAPLESAEV